MDKTSNQSNVEKIKPLPQKAGVERASNLMGVILPDCKSINHASLDRDSAIGKFEAEFPAVIVSDQEIDNLELKPKQIAMLTEYAACMSGISGYDPSIAESSLALFSSPKFGKEALESLASQARKNNGAHGAQARGFEDQIQGYLQSSKEK